MATVIKADGTEQQITIPTDEGQLSALQHEVGGYIEHHVTPDGKDMFMNEDGRRLVLQVNAKATALMGYMVLGNVVVSEPGEIE